MNYCYINKKNQKNAYLDFVKDLCFDNTISFKRFPKDYNGDETVKFACTQHSKVIDFKETVSDYERNKITKSWVDFLSSEQLPLKEVQFCTVTPQKIFDAVCTQATIESLRFKWLKCKDINAISNLSN